MTRLDNVDVTSQPLPTATRHAKAHISSIFDIWVFVVRYTQVVRVGIVIVSRTVSGSTECCLLFLVSSLVYRRQQKDQCYLIGKWKILVNK